MPNRVRWLVSAGVLVLLVGAGRPASTQQFESYYIKYNSGQAIQPIFEGWSKNADGSFTMHFGYLNRNYVETPSVPVGLENNIQPGGPDKGQPTFFAPRSNRRQFGVTVPKDWGKKELIWTLTVHGSTEKAIGWLQPEWEVTATGSGSTATRGPKNAPPTITALDPVATVTIPKPATLTANVTDDGLPKPRSGRPRPAVGQETPPILQGPTDAPVNVPQLAGRGGRTAGGPQRPQGLTVSWIVWRGPAAVSFEPGQAPVKDGKAVVTATFAKAGEYVLRARANDGALTTEQDLKVTVTDSRSSSQH